MHVQIGLRDCIRIQQAVFSSAIDPWVVRSLPNAAVDREMSNMNILRRQFSRHALRKSAQAEFAHREGGRVCISPVTRRCASQKDRPASSLEHETCRRLSYEKSAIAGDKDGLAHGLDVQVDDGPSPAAITRVIDNDIRDAVCRNHAVEQ